MAAPPLNKFAGAVNSAFVTGSVGVVSPSVSWAVGDLVAVFSGTAGALNGTAMTTPTTTGSGLSFTQKQTHTDASDPPAALYEATATAASSGTITCGWTTTASDLGFVLVLVVDKSSGGFGVTNLSTGSSRTVALTVTAVDSLVGWIVLDWAAAAVQSFTPVASSHTSASPGPTAAPFSGTNAGNFTYYGGELDDQTTTGASNYGIGGSGTGPFTIIAAEFLATAGGGAVVLPNLTMAPMIGN